MMSVMSRPARWVLSLTPIGLTMADAVLVAVAIRAFTFHTQFCLVSRTLECWEQPLTTSAKLTGTSAAALGVILLATVGILSLRLSKKASRRR